MGTRLGIALYRAAVTRTLSAIACTITGATQRRGSEKLRTSKQRKPYSCTLLYIRKVLLSASPQNIKHKLPLAKAVSYTNFLLSFFSQVMKARTLSFNFSLYWKINCFLSKCAAQDCRIAGRQAARGRRGSSPERSSLKRKRREGDSSVWHRHRTARSTSALASPASRLTELDVTAGDEGQPTESTHSGAAGTDASS